MSTVKLIMDDGEYELDLGVFMLSEATALQREWDVDTMRFTEMVTSGSPPLKVVGAMVWLVKVRAIASAEGIPFVEAAKQLPVATFDTNLAALQLDMGGEPANPTPGVTPTPKTRTTRATSAKPRAKRSSKAA